MKPGWCLALALVMPALAREARAQSVYVIVTGAVMPAAATPRVRLVIDDDSIPCQRIPSLPQALCGAAIDAGASSLRLVVGAPGFKASAHNHFLSQNQVQRDTIRLDAGLVNLRELSLLRVTTTRVERRHGATVIRLSIRDDWGEPFLVDSVAIEAYDFAAATPKEGCSTDTLASFDPVILIELAGAGPVAATVVLDTATSIQGAVGHVVRNVCSGARGLVVRLPTSFLINSGGARLGMEVRLSLPPQYRREANAEADDRRPCRTSGDTASGCLDLSRLRLFVIRMRPASDSLGDLTGCFATTTGNSCPDYLAGKGRES